MDAATIRAVAELARKRAAHNDASHGDGMARLGAERALTQLAIDLDITANSSAARALATPPDPPFPARALLPAGIVTRQGRDRAQPELGRRAAPIEPGARAAGSRSPSRRLNRALVQEGRRIRQPRSQTPVQTIAKVSDDHPRTPIGRCGWFVAASGQK